MKIARAFFTKAVNRSTFAEHLRVTHEIGYEGVEIPYHLVREADSDFLRSARRAADAVGLRICCLSTVFGANANGPAERQQQELDGIRNAAEIAEPLGCGVVRISAGAMNTPTDEDGLKAMADWMAQAADLARPFGVSLAPETHPGQFTENAGLTRRLLQQCGAENVGVIYDAANMLVTGVPYGSRIVHELGDAIIHVHLKDMARCGADEDGAHEYPGGCFKYVFMGEGDMDHRETFAALKSIGFEGYMTCECIGPEADPTPRARHEFAVVKSLLDSAD
ncbi:MAG: sugar phosphate isomerase/epimerase [Planctomycetes bacterium]|nr:sugar phosphate isomerase/epimerase [Planctomycetota bacterium]